MKNILKFILAATCAAVCGCNSFEDFPPVSSDTPVEVAFAMGDGIGTRTVYDQDSKRFVWQAGDVVSVWARSSDGAYVLNNETFKLLAAGLDRSMAYFTATLQSPMDEGTYSYLVSYPLPESVDGTVARFTVPDVQDGTASGGVDIMVADPVSGPALSPLEEGTPIAQENVMNVRMKHLLHFLKFYIPESCNVLGEPVARIEFTMPRSVAGKISVDVSDISSARLEDGAGSMTLELRNPINESKDASDFALCGIFPPEVRYSSGDLMTVNVYSENKWAAVPISLAGRDFAAGHITKVPLRPIGAKPIDYELKFVLLSNNLGEDVQKITVSLPDGEAWPGTSSSVLEIGGGSDGVVRVGDTYTFSTQDKSFFRGLTSKKLTVGYESENALVSEVVTLGDFSSGVRRTCGLNCPYLFFEDFSWVVGFNSNDEYSWSSAGSYSPYLFAPYTISDDNPWSPEKGGWSAARAGAQDGTAIRIACRRETGLANYPARADSPYLVGLKKGKTVNLEVSYDYSMNREGDPSISQTVYFGYITTGDTYKSGDSNGTFPVKFSVKETTGSYTNINHTADATLTGVKAPLRLSWRTVPQTNWGANNNTCWLYLDNIKVKIKK